MADLGKFEDFWNGNTKAKSEASTEEAFEKGDKILDKFKEHGAVKHNFYKEKQQEVN